MRRSVSASSIRLSMTGHGPNPSMIHESAAAAVTDDRDPPHYAPCTKRERGPGLALPTGLARKSASALLAALRENRVLGLLGDAELEHALRRD